MSEHSKYGWLIDRLEKLDPGMTGNFREVLSVDVAVEQGKHGQFFIPVPVNDARENDCPWLSNKLAMYPFVPVILTEWPNGAVELDVHGIIVKGR